ncbi:helix-turn-helix domain-containing protein [Spiribacter halobius]|uniref:Transcriptional regulator n=1 Tax=Sediminicurvatus halobius TaxID=2182432 RepID=A0A2U2MYG8_9GAMM|nr:helix-turn-helix domain-containing protein [Spiribacter halobius]PWG61843.1 transcriptional regulator [Spiribacter halobius]UEX77685.1 helix-turn-helix domain-containing protein [Spiribacter halobius]
MTDSIDVLEKFRDLRREDPERDEAIERTAPQREVAGALICLRHAAGFTQGEMAEAVGATTADVSRLESTAGDLDLKILAAYLHACRARLQSADGPPPGPTNTE